MSLQISDNFSYQGRKPLDARLLCETKNKLDAIPVNTIYNGILVYVEEESAYYSYNKEHETDASVSAWTKLDFNNTIEETQWVVPYKQGTTFVKDTLVYYNDSLALVSNDFTSNSSLGTIEESFIADLNNGNLIRMTREDVDIPECLGSVKTDKAEDLPANPIKGNWVLIDECVNTAPGQAGIGLYNGTS